MKTLMQELDDMRAEGTVLEHDEADLLLMGDLNANNYRSPEEVFFETLNTGDWALLAPESGYPATRLSGVPFEPRTSQIDYIFASRKTAAFSGLLGEEISEEEASVHWDIADEDWEGFRRTYSDHFPVSTCLTLTSDCD